MSQPRSVRRSRRHHHYPRQRPVRRGGWESAPTSVLTGRTRRIVTDLPAELVKKLNETARKFRRSRQTIIQVACEDWLDSSKYQKIRREIALSVSADRGGSPR